MFTSQPSDLSFPKREGEGVEEDSPFDKEFQRLIEETERLALAEPLEPVEGVEHLEHLEHEEHEEHAEPQEDEGALFSAVDADDWEGALEILKAHPALSSFFVDVMFTPLMRAIRDGARDSEGHEHLLRRLLELSPDLSVASPVSQQNVLHTAAECGDMEALRLLLSTEEGKALVNSQAEAGMTPLMFAATNGHMDIIKALVDAGADVNAADHDQWSALWALADQGDAQAFQQLVEMGATIKGEDTSGNTILHVAALAGAAEIVKSILQSGQVDKEATNDAGLTAKQIAETYGHKDIADIL